MHARKLRAKPDCISLISLMGSANTHAPMCAVIPEIAGHLTSSYFHIQNEIVQ